MTRRWIFLFVSILGILRDDHDLEGAWNDEENAEPLEGCYDLQSRDDVYPEFLKSPLLASDWVVQEVCSSGVDTNQLLIHII